MKFISPVCKNKIISLLPFESKLIGHTIGCNTIECLIKLKCCAFISLHFILKHIHTRGADLLPSRLHSARGIGKKARAKSESGSRVGVKRRAKWRQLEAL